MIKVMIVDDHDVVREGLKMILSLDSEIDIIAELPDGSNAIEVLKRITPDIILMDIRMPLVDGVSATKAIKCLYPGIKIIILTTFNEDAYIRECLRNGADGYILKDTKADEILKGIRTVYSGNVLLQPEIATKVIKELSSFDRETSKEELSKLESLTQREDEIANLISSGMSNKEIGDFLFISEGTVRNHITNILSKLELRDRTQLALYLKKTKKF